MSQGVNILPDDKGNPPQFQLFGSNLSYPVADDYTQTVNISAGGNAIVTITPPTGELWHVKMLSIVVPAIATATTGNQEIDVINGLSNNIYLSNLRAINAYNANLQILRNYVEAGSTATTPTTEQAQQQAILSLAATNSNPLSVVITNNTDAAQTQAVPIWLQKVVEAIV